MLIFTVGSLFVLAALGWFVWGRKYVASFDDNKREQPEFTRGLVTGTSVVGILVGFVLVVISTAIYVEDNQGGVVVVKFGQDLEPNRIIATDGQKGPQAEVLPPGWHFGYWPWIYSLESVKNEIIPQGKVGVVTTMDGAPLPEGQVYAAAWDDPIKMMDAQTFLTSGRGQKGPQLTVLTPGQYRYNPRLYTIQHADLLDVKVGEVVVIKANAGPTYEAEVGTEVLTVNGTPIVMNGHRGIWREALTPNSYYLHPTAYQVVRVGTTNRIFNYVKDSYGTDQSTVSDARDDKSIRVRTKDGFQFAVDVRVSIKISAEDAPYVVARLGNPDGQVQGGYTVIEERVVLPLIRSIFRNTAESKNALEFVQNRSEIEKDATRQFEEGLAEWKITTDGVSIADIGLDETEQGRRLLQTQTDREVAQQEKETYERQREAQLKRAEMEKAREDANQEKNKAAAAALVTIREREAEARIKEAHGEAEAIRMKIEAEGRANAEAYKQKITAIGGADNWLALEMFSRAAERWSGSVPGIVVAGGSGGDSGDGGGLFKAWLAQMLRQNQKSPVAPNEGLGDK